MSSQAAGVVNIHHDNWLRLAAEFGKLFPGPIGTLQ
jgi:hypothetical protein